MPAGSPTGKVSTEFSAPDPTARDQVEFGIEERIMGNEDRPQCIPIQTNQRGQNSGHGIVYPGNLHGRKAGVPEDPVPEHEPIASRFKAFVHGGRLSPGVAT